MPAASSVRPSWGVLSFRVLACALVVLAPLKFSSVVMSGEAAGMLSSDWIVMLFNYWPIFLVPMLSGALLLLALVLFPLPSWNRAWWIPGVWLGLLLGMLPGLLATTEHDVASMLWIHFHGLAALAVALFLWVRRDRQAQTWLLAALTLAGLVMAGFGWQQRVFGGLDRFEQEAKTLSLRQFAQRADDQAWNRCQASAQEFLRLQGVAPDRRAAIVAQDLGALRLQLSAVSEVPSAIDPAATAIADRYGRHLYVEMGMEDGILKRMEQRRAYGTFGYPNAYAACLLLLGPIMILGLWRLGGHFEPAKVSSPLLAALGGGYWLGALGFSESRSAVLALAVGVGLAALAIPAWRRWRLWAVLGAAVVAILLVLVISQVGGRKILGTLWSRLDYWKVAVRLFWEHPWTGVGWGEFYPWYQRLKPLEAEMARTPHCFVLKFASQAGIAGLVAALAFLSLPAQLAWGRFSAWIKDIPLQVAVIVGFGAWTAHSLTDFNFIGSGLMVLAVVVSLLALEPEEMPAPESQRSQWPISLSLGLLLGFVAVWSNKLQAPAQLALQELERSDLTLPQRDFLVRTGLRHRPYYMEPWQKLSWKCWEEDAVHPSAEARQIGLEAVRRMVALTPHRSGVLVYAAKVEATVAPAFVRGESAEAQRSNLSRQLDRAEALAKQAKLWAGQDQLCLQQVDEVLALCARRRQELQLPSP